MRSMAAAKVVARWKMTVEGSEKHGERGGSSEAKYAPAHASVTRVEICWFRGHTRPRWWSLSRKRKVRGSFSPTVVATTGSATVKSLHMYPGATLQRLAYCCIRKYSWETRRRKPIMRTTFSFHRLTYPATVVLPKYLGKALIFHPVEQR